MYRTRSCLRFQLPFLCPGVCRLPLAFHKRDSDVPLLRFMPRPIPAAWTETGLPPAFAQAAAATRIGATRTTDALVRAAADLNLPPGDIALASLAVLLSRLTRQETISIQVHHAQIDFHLAPETPFSLLVHSLRQNITPDAPPIVIHRPIRGRGDAHSVRFLFNPEPGEVESASFCALLLIVRENGRQLELQSTNGLWTGETLTQWLGYLVTLIEILPEKADSVPGAALQTPIDRLPLWDQSSARSFYAAWNQTETTFPGPKTAVERFREQAKHSPDAIAVVSGQSHFTYREMDQRSTQLAHLLADIGAGPGRAVAVCMDRSIHLPAALLAILKSGSFYVPLEASHPGPRLRGILEECAPAAILTDEIWAGSVAGWLAGLPVPILHADAPDLPQSRHPLPATIDPESLAYTIYTSGTTGKPKGVRIQHRALANLVCSIAAQPGIQPSDLLLGVAPISFDIASMDVFLPLCTGATLVLAGRTDAADPYRLADLIEAHGITLMQATPATWSLLITSGWLGKRDLRILCGGEAVSRELANSLIERGSELWNCYGPTETTIWSAVLRIHPGQGIVPVGPPMANTTFYVLDPAGNPLPPGIPGELAIGGIGVSQGYVQRPELNAQRFIPNPFSNAFSANPEARIFRTGDLVRLVENDIEGRVANTDDSSYVLEFFGRLDHQVKLRGYRIELGEIESVLRTHASIADAVAILREDTPGEPRLVAYVIAEKPVDSHALVDHAAATLPAYMLPSAVVHLEKFPLSTSGKIDRRALPAPESVPAQGSILQSSEAAGELEGSSIEAGDPETSDIETKLLRIFREVLRNDSVGIHDNFFRYGGYSLLTIRLFSRIDRELGARLPISLLFDAPTVRQLAEVIRKGSAPSIIVPIRPQGSAAPIFLIQSYLLYAAMLEMIEPDRPIYGVRELSDEAEPLTIAERARIFAKEIAAIAPQGPLYLAGWCAAGTLTVEIARQLHDSGREVGLVALFDAERPGYAPPSSLTHITTRLRSKTAFHYARLRPRDWKQRLAYIADAAAHNRESAIDAWYAVSYRLLRWLHKRFSFQLPASAFHHVYANMSAVDNQQIRPYPGRLHLYRAADVPQRGDQDATLGWAEVANHVDVRFVSGDHLSMFKKPHVDSLAQLLRQQMQNYETVSAKS